MPRNLPPEIWNLIDTFRSTDFQKRVRHLQRRLKFPRIYHDYPVCHTGCHYLVIDDFRFSRSKDPLAILLPINHKLTWCHEDQTFEMASAGMGRDFVVACYDYFDGSSYITYP